MRRGIGGWGGDARREAYRVARLLREDLRELDHVRVVVERLGEVDHRVRRVLLLAGTRGGEERRERGHGDRVALFGTTCSELWNQCRSQLTLVLTVRKLSE